MYRWALTDADMVATVTVQEEQPGVAGLWVQIPDGVRPGDKYDGTDFSKVVVEVVVMPVRLTQLAFDLRLTADERIAIRTAAVSDASVNDAFRLKEKATFIDLTAEITYQLIGKMVMAGCIAAERIPVILDVSTVTEGDMYRGPV